MPNPKRSTNHSGEPDSSGVTAGDMALNVDELSLNTTSLMLPEESAGIQKVFAFRFAESEVVLVLD